MFLKFNICPKYWYNLQQTTAGINFIQFNTLKVFSFHISMIYKKKKEKAPKYFLK